MGNEGSLITFASLTSSPRRPAGDGGPALCHVTTTCSFPHLRMSRHCAGDSPCSQGRSVRLVSGNGSNRFFAQSPPTTGRHAHVNDSSAASVSTFYTPVSCLWPFAVVAHSRLYIFIYIYFLIRCLRGVHSVFFFSRTILSCAMLLLLCNVIVVITETLFSIRTFAYPASLS